jgi:hypothetical protein
MSRRVTPSDVGQELALRGGLLPLMHLFPGEESHPGSSIPWQNSDLALQQWLRTSPAYAAAVTELDSCHDDG